jgi:hypothetical protein
MGESYMKSILKILTSLFIFLLILNPVQGQSIPPIPLPGGLPDTGIPSLPEDARRHLEELNRPTVNGHPLCLVEQGKSELFITEVEANPHKIHPGQEIIFSVTVKNTKTKACSFHVELREEGRVLDTARVDSLDYHETAIVELKASWNWAGVYPIDFVVDSNNRISEVNEFNNELATSIKVIMPEQFAPVTPTPPSTPPSGDVGDGSTDNGTDNGTGSADGSTDNSGTDNSGTDNSNSSDDSSNDPGPQDNDKEDAEDAIEIAEDLLRDVQDAISDARDALRDDKDVDFDDDDVDDAKDEKDEIKDLLDQAETAKDEGRYDDAVDLAEEAEEKAEDVLDDLHIDEPHPFVSSTTSTTFTPQVSNAQPQREQQIVIQTIEPPHVEEKQEGESMLPFVMLTLALVILIFLNGFLLYHLKTRGKKEEFLFE